VRVVDPEVRVLTNFFTKMLKTYKYFVSISVCFSKE